MSADMLVYSFTKELPYDDEQKMFLIPYVCPHLKETKNLKSDFRDQDVAKGDYYCDIYDKRPALCSRYKGKRMAKGQEYYVPPTCTMGKK